ncbi:MAG TPA: GntR family transcriptional regulator [Limnochordia bacterium]|jgi:DNA-binding transcriptional regulator YhcF (GntR family)|nr:GntR family transcriptional regulator [Bacillota bacterium]HKM43598.1 GntR family transcriptional regulator [Limnochordia bacterium]
MRIALDMTSEEPIYLQLRNEIVLGIGSGRLAAGDGLPSVRQLADDLGINAMTVNKTYGLLKDQGFIEIDRRQGARVRVDSTQEPHFPTLWQKQLTLLMAEGLARGMTRDEFLATFEGVFEQLNQGGRIG